MINTANEVTDMIADQKVLPDYYQLKLGFIIEKSDDLAAVLAAENSRVQELEMVVAEARAMDQREKKNYETAKSQLEFLQKEEAELQESVQAALKSIDDQAKLKEKLLKELQELQKDIDKEKLEALERHESIKKVCAEQRHLFNEIQNIKGNVRVCVRIKPEQPSNFQQGRTGVPQRSFSQPFPQGPSFKLIEYDDIKNDLYLKMPTSVRSCYLAHEIIVQLQHQQRIPVRHRAPGIGKPKESL